MTIEDGKKKKNLLIPSSENIKYFSINLIKKYLFLNFVCNIQIESWLISVATQFHHLEQQ